MKEGSPYRNIMYITRAGSRCGYISDTSGHGIFEAMLKDGLREMMDEYAHEAY